MKRDGGDKPGSQSTDSEDEKGSGDLTGRIVQIEGLKRWEG